MPLPRLHLFELEDQGRFPSVWRNYMTDYLRHVERKFGLHRPAMPILERLLEESGAERIVDLCSGSGGPLLDVLAEWAEEGREIPAVLTDLYPHPESLESRADGGSTAAVEYRAEPVDALRVPVELTGVRTLFNGLHHFRPDDARDVLKDAVRTQSPIAVFEVADRSLAAMASLILVPLFVLVTTPMIRPFRWSRLAWTYMIPVLPAAILWDGVVSYLRAYRPDELEAMAEAASPDGYRWEAGYLRFEAGPGRLTYLAGAPVSSRA